MKFLFSIIYILAFLASAQAGECDNPEIVEKKVNALKVEVACAQLDSLHACRELFKAESIEAPDFFSDAQVHSCEGIPIRLAGVSLAAQSLVSTADSVAAHTEQLFVNNIEDFYQHTELHRKRVRELGLTLFRQHPELFEGLHESQLKAALDAHDLAKISPQALTSDGRPFYQVLYHEGYGRGLDREIVDQLNAADKDFMNKTLSKIGLDNNAPMSEAQKAKVMDLRTKIERIEKIADFVDRGMSNVSPEEFGRPMQRASTFMQNEADIILAQQLEANYTEIVEKFEYKTPNNIKRNQIKLSMKINESFSKALRAGSKKASISAMAHAAYMGGRLSFANLLGFLSSKYVMRGLVALDFFTLYFADMNSLACDGVGYHDWVKDPNCRPAIGLTPKVVQLLAESPELQLRNISSSGSTCKVVSETYEQSMKAPKILSCSPNQVELQLDNEDKFKVEINELGNISKVHFQHISNSLSNYTLGFPESATIGDDGKITEECFRRLERGTDIRYCLPTTTADRTVKAIMDKTQEVFKALNYQMQKAVDCCLSSGESSQFKCNS